MKYTTALALIAFVVMVASNDAAAQHQSRPSSGRDARWLAIGIGARYDRLLNAGVSVSIGRRRVWQVALQNHEDRYFNDYESRKRVSALALGYGFTHANRWSRVSVTGGPAYVWGWRLRDAPADAYERISTGGVFVNGQIVFSPVPEIGIGLGAFTNVNRPAPVAGLRLLFVIEGNK